MRNACSTTRIRIFSDVCLLVIVLFVYGGVGQDLAWWQTSIIYQVYPRSHKDSNEDGVGDLQGIISKLDYFKYLGVDSFWLSPVYSSPMRDFGYDISNYTNIDPLFGTLQDFDELVNKSHGMGLNIIMDYVPGHTSTDHVWFQNSVNRVGNYTDYYIWSNGTTLPNGTRAAPNNWLSVFGGTAWSWNEVRQQYYYHAFLPQQADLNYRNPNVQEEMKGVLRFWLDRGVDGFRVDAIEKLYEVENVTLNEPPSGQNVPPFQYEYLNHIYTSNQPETYPTVASWYQVLEEYKKKDGKDRYMVVELYAEPAIRNKLYETGGSPFNFDLVDLTSNVTGTEIRDRVLNEYNNLPAGKWPNFVLGNHDRRRVSYKFGAKFVDVYNMLLLTLWGTPTTYYGEEIGMLEAIVSFNQSVDPWGKNFGPDRYQEFSRDPERSPMQWTGAYQAGFTTATTTWLPLGQNYTTINVETEQNAPGMSTIKLYAQLAKLRKMPAFQQEKPEIAFVDANIFSYFRLLGGNKKYLVAINVGKQEFTIDFTSMIATDDNTTATITAYTPGVMGVTEGSTIKLSSTKLSPGDGLLLQITKKSSGNGLRPGFVPYCLSITIVPILLAIFLRSKVD